MRKRRVGRRHKMAPVSGLAFELRPDHAALSEGRTIFPSTVAPPGPGDTLLKSGFNNPKIGDRVTAGRWIGMPIFTLTLEERATCPDTCHMWRGCMGNRMHRAKRWDLSTPAAQDQLFGELQGKQNKHPEGFVVRPHILGDFFSVEYVRLWAYALDTMPALRMWGYTSRTLDDPIGAAIRTQLCWPHPQRVAIRTSVAAPINYTMEALTAGLDEPLTGGSFLCPAEVDDEVVCGNCTACWESKRNVTFRLHGG